MPSALIIIAQQGYQDTEYAHTRSALETGGFAVVVASAEAGPCVGKFGGTVDADIALEDVDVAQYDCIAFIGGPGAAAYADDPHALRIARDAADRGIPLGAVCIAPIILAKAGVLAGKRATVWNEDGQQAAVLEAGGAVYTGELVTVDGMLVTGNGPAAAAAFGETLVNLH